MSDVIRQKNSTDDLMKQLLESGDIRKYIESRQEDYGEDAKVVDYLEFLILRKSLKKARVIEQSGIDRIYGYEIFRGRKIPGRDTLVRILLAMEVGIEDTQHILKNTGYPILYAKNIRDAIIIYGIKNLLGVDGVNTLLDDMGQKAL